ncbi:hypothetical protein L1049_027259 [Liquidambar formosana]|uniref:Glycosyltransferase N-terminal domain-containing protein n=1 Tax=Liquidambar formosana TaxID=63359 RepID=A0AAP0R4J5_LIQFO
MALPNVLHAVCIPFPAQSHIKGMLKLAKLLHHRGFHITFVNTEFNHKRLLKARALNSLDGLPDFQFKTIPDGLPPSDPDATQDISSLFDSSTKNFLGPFRDLLAKLNHASTAASSNVLPVTCIIGDAFLTFTTTAAEELGIPVVLFSTVSASRYMAYKQYRPLMERGLTPLKDASCLTNGYLHTIIDWIPGMKDMRLRDLPSLVRTMDPNDALFGFAMGEAERGSKASAIIFHTFHELEQNVLDALSSMLPRVYAIGPLELLLKQLTDDHLKSIGASLWKEEHECLEWLNSKEPNSVVYVNFGSITVMTPQQLVEFSWGLANSNHSFLWIIRPDLVVGESAILPPEFVAETKERGLIASWCPQEQVLNHPSTAGFLTHCGWNSTLESLSSGSTHALLAILC